MADCRKCVHFIPYSEMPDDLVEQDLVWIAKFRPGEHLLGHCRKRNLPVTYATGPCRFFVKKDSHRQQTLEKWIPLPKW